MEAGHARGNRDNPRLPTLSLGLSSVRLIVNKIEAEYARAVAPDAHGRELVKYDPNIDDDDYYDPPLDASRAGVLNRFVANLGLAIRKCIPSVSFGNFAVLAVAAGFVAPKMFSYLLIYPFCRLVFGTLYPAYASYKAVRTKNLKEYVKWMMYWIVFALFTCTETFTDVFLSWFPFYYEVKIVLVLWLLSPATKGSSILYRKFVHPALCRREQEIDEYIAKAKDQGYHTVLNLGTKGVNYATTVIMQTAIKGGGGLVQQLRKSYSLSDLSECDARDETRHDEADDVLPEPRLIRRTAKTAYNTRRSASESNNRGMYFPEVDVDVRAARRTDEPDLSHIKSSDDISSGYSSADNSASLSRAGSLSRRPRPRTAVTTIKRPAAAEDNEVIIEELHDDDVFDYANMPPLVNLSPSPLFISQSDPPFLYQYVGDQIKIIQILGDQVPNNSKPNFMQRDQTETVTKDNLTKKQDLNKSDKVNQDQQQDSVVNEYSDTEQILKTESITIASTFIDEDTFENAIDVNNDQDNVNMSIPNDNNGETDGKIKNISEIDTKNSVDVNSSVDDTNVQTIAEKSKEEAEIATDTDDHQDCASLEMSPNENDSADSDDEASFGTPDNSPKSKRKSPKGRYGKGKAPPPPKIENIEVKETKENTSTISDAVSTTSQESLVDIVNRMPNETIRESGNFKGLHVVNPIAEKKRRHKSKSPAKIPKGSTSGIGKLLQIPGKLAFWNKSDDKSKDSVSSSDNSRRSSTAEKPIEDFQSCLNVDMGTADVKVNEDNFTFRDANDFDTESVSQEIIDKSNALLKVIEEKLETHPEYKFVSLHEEIPTASKSTDV